MNNAPSMESKVGAPPATPASRLWRRVVVRLLRVRVWFTERGPGDIWESNYFWAVLVGLSGAVSSVAFREALRYLERIFLHSDSPLEYASTALPWWGRMLMPAVGGMVAGSILLVGQRWSNVGRSTDFMEAVVLGNGVIRVRATLIK